MDKIILTTKLTIDDYIKVNYHLLYRKSSIKFLTGIGLFMLILILFTFNSFAEFPWFQLAFGLFLTVGLPVSIYFSARRNYKSNGRISETIIYEFDKENIQLTGESFNSKLTWDKIYSVTENKDWILIWQNRQVANVVPKRDFTEGQLQAFKDIVRSHGGLKNRLKR
jgi:hypothetical protein